MENVLDISKLFSSTVEQPVVNDNSETETPYTPEFLTLDDKPEDKKLSEGEQVVSYFVKRSNDRFAFSNPQHMNRRQLKRQKEKQNKKNINYMKATFSKEDVENWINRHKVK